MSHRPELLRNHVVKSIVVAERDPYDDVAVMMCCCRWCYHHLSSWSTHLVLVVVDDELAMSVAWATTMIAALVPHSWCCRDC